MKDLKETRKDYDLAGYRFHSGDIFFIPGDELDELGLIKKPFSCEIF